MIREERSADIDTIRLLTADAFLHAAHSDHTEHRIIDALRAADKLTLSLVAEIDGEIAGHIAFSPVSIEDGAPGWQGLGPLAVAPARQSTGIGSALVERGLEALRTIGASGCVVLGNPRFYTRFGFAQAAPLHFEGVPPDYFMALQFDDAARPSGAVQYSQAFFIGDSSS